MYIFVNRGNNKDRKKFTLNTISFKKFLHLYKRRHKQQQKVST